MIDLNFLFQYLKGRCHGMIFSLGAEVSQDALDRFSQPLHYMVGTELQMINPTFFLIS